MATVELLEEKTMAAMNSYDTAADKAVEVLSETLRLEPDWLPGLLLMRGLYYRCRASLCRARCTASRS